MELQERITVMAQLGAHLQEKDEYLEALMHRTYHHNSWFTLANQQKRVALIAEQFLTQAHLEDWVSQYSISKTTIPKTIGLVLADNIPLAGFYDVLSVFIAGHRAKIRLSEKDKFVLPYLIKLLSQFDPRVAAYFEIVPKLTDFDAVIVTSSQSSIRYMETYFGKYPHIIKCPRNTVAVLHGQETEEDLRALGTDIFQYFGLSARSVSKIYVPKGYDFNPLLEVLHEQKELVLHTKYKNNFDYNYALYLLNSVEMKINGCVILTENRALQSRIAGVHYEYYGDLADLEIDLYRLKDKLECIVAKETLLNLQTIPFGQAHLAKLEDFPNGEDILRFLSNLTY